MNNNFLNIFKGDKVIWVCVLFLSVISIVEVYSSSTLLAYQEKSGNTVYYLLKQVVLLMFGFIVMFTFSRVTYKILFKYSNVLLVLAWFFLICTFFTDEKLNDAHRWVKIPVVGLRFQPSDIVKCFLAIFLARNLSECQNNEEERKLVFLKCMGAILITCGLIVPSNFSTACLVGFTGLSVMFIGRVPVKYLTMFIGACALAFVLFIGFLKVTGTEQNSRLGTWIHRIEAHIGSKSTKVDSNSQAVQARIAVARGGLTGHGFGSGLQRNVLSQSYSDFIYAIIIEEGGLVSGLVVMLLYFFIFVRCYFCVARLERTFPAFLVVGFSLNIILQALANMLVSVNIMPVTGQALPLVSMGGTSILFTSFQFGVILNITRYSGRKERVEEIEEDQQSFNINVDDYPIMVG